MLIVKSIKEVFSVSSPNALSSFLFMLLSELDPFSPPLLSTLSSFTVSFLPFPHLLLVLSLESEVLDKGYRSSELKFYSKHRQTSPDFSLLLENS